MHVCPRWPLFWPLTQGFGWTWLPSHLPEGSAPACHLLAFTQPLLNIRSSYKRPHPPAIPGHRSLAKSVSRKQRTSVVYSLNVASFQRALQFKTSLWLFLKPLILQPVPSIRPHNSSHLLRSCCVLDVTHISSSNPQNSYEK